MGSLSGEKSMVIKDVNLDGWYLSDGHTLVFTPRHSLAEGTRQRRFVEFVLKRPLTHEEKLAFDPRTMIGMEFDYDEWRQL
jgi:hypothetical protein